MCQDEMTRYDSGTLLGHHHRMFPPTLLNTQRGDDITPDKSKQSIDVEDLNKVVRCSGKGGDVIGGILCVWRRRRVLQKH